MRVLFRRRYFIVRPDTMTAYEQTYTGVLFGRRTFIGVHRSTRIGDVAIVPHAGGAAFARHPFDARNN